ncbi:hypothetical protein JCM33374_g2977 [Metschnikowia sp. JCM 33374]|nr:hypothetical protein JCM33374_g2977 [Metschnikowia sp. JCM 33374]
MQKTTMYLRRKPPQGYFLDELQETYNDVSDMSIRNLALEDQGQYGEALRGWKSIHTSLLYKIDAFERKSAKMNTEEIAMLDDLKAIRDENVKHLARIQLRLDEQSRMGKKLAESGSAANHGHMAHKMSIPSLRSSNPSSRSLNSSQQRSMVKSLRNGGAGGATANPQMSSQNRDAIKAAAALSWAKPKPASASASNGALAPAPRKYDADMFGDFDQMEIPAAQYGRLNSVTSTGSAGAKSDTPDSVNLIDLDDRHLAHSPNLHRSLEDLSLAKKKSPPPIPPKKGGLRISVKKPEDVSSGFPLSDSLARPGVRVASKSTSDIPEIPAAPEPKKYVYKQPQPLNISNLMQKTTSRTKPTANGQPKRPSATPSQAPKAHTTATDTVRAQVKQVKKSNITYNYKPVEKARPTASRPSAGAPRASASVKPPAKTKAKNPPTPTSPYMNNIINDYESDEDRVEEPTPEPPKASGDLSAEEQAALIRSIKGIDEASANQILNDIVVRGDEVYWDDIVGLEAAKYSLKEAVVYPFLRPDLFRGLREPTRGMLLFGPPGTGKTMLARAVATESKSTFFSISSSSLTSKYLGESEKLVKALFLLAKKLSPSIVFIDEIDSLLGTRNEGEVESMRRIKNEFLVQWSELSSAAAGRDSADGDVSRVLILGATNLPWGIDEAARRRFAKRVYIPLPENETRKLQISKLLAYQNHTLSEDDFNKLIDLTEGFSGSDITLLAKDSAMGPLRSLGDKLLSTPTEEIRPIKLEDFVESLKYIRPSVSSEGLGEYENWASKFGSSGA